MPFINLKNTKSTLLTFATILFGLLHCQVSFSQEKEVIHRGEQWLQYNLNALLSEKWVVFGNSGVRWRDGFENYSVFFGRIGAGFNLNRTIRVASGFTYAELKSEGNTYLAEFRPYEELLVRPRSDKKFGLSHRFRFEQRFYNPVIDHRIQSDNTFAVRLRYALMTRIPIAKLSKTNADLKLSLRVYDEVMVNAGKNIVYNVFDKNRFVIMPTLQFNKWMTVALGYNYQFFNTSSAGEYVHTDALWFHLSHTINLTKRKEVEEDYHDPITPEEEATLE